MSPFTCVWTRGRERDREDSVNSWARERERARERDLFNWFPHNLRRCDRDNKSIVTENTERERERERESRWRDDGGTVPARSLNGLPAFKNKRFSVKKGELRTHHHVVRRADRRVGIFECVRLWVSPPRHLQGPCDCARVSKHKESFDLRWSTALSFAF